MQNPSDPIDGMFLPSENDPMVETSLQAAAPTESIKIDQVEAAIRQAESVIFLK
jgi:hypothetical protein